MCKARGSSRVVLVVAVVLSVALEQAGAAELFSTLGPGNSYSMSLSSPVGLIPGFGNVAEGNQFSFTTLPASYLDTIELAAALDAGTNQLDVALMTDAAGQPGSVIESFSFTDQMGNSGDNNPLLVGTSVLRPLLMPNTNYWLVASALDNTSASWNTSSPVVTGVHAMRVDAGSWIIGTTDLDAFRIDGTPVVPAPGALLLGGIGLALVGWVRRCKTT